MKESFKKVYLMGTVRWLRLMGEVIQDPGTWERKKEMDMKLVRKVELNIEGSLGMIRFMERESMRLKGGTSMKETLWTMIFKGMELANGLTKKSMWAHGIRIKCMEKGNLHGLLVNGMKEIL